MHRLSLFLSGKFMKTRYVVHFLRVLVLSVACYDVVFAMDHDNQYEKLRGDTLNSQLSDTIPMSSSTHSDKALKSKKCYSSSEGENEKFNTSIEIASESNILQDSGLPKIEKPDRPCFLLILSLYNAVRSVAYELLNTWAQYYSKVPGYIYGVISHFLLHITNNISDYHQDKINVDNFSENDQFKLLNNLNFLRNFQTFIDRIYVWSEFFTPCIVLGGYLTGNKYIGDIIDYCIVTYYALLDGCNDSMERLSVLPNKIPEKVVSKRFENLKKPIIGDQEENRPEKDNITKKYCKYDGVYKKTIKWCARKLPQGAISALSYSMNFLYEISNNLAQYYPDLWKYYVWYTISSINHVLANISDDISEARGKELQDKSAKEICQKHQEKLEKWQSGIDSVYNIFEYITVIPVAFVRFFRYENGVLELIKYDGYDENNIFTVDVSIACFYSVLDGVNRLLWTIDKKLSKECPDKQREELIKLQKIML